MDLGGASVLITGGRRVGSALARALADRGARIAMTYRTSREAIEQTIADCRIRGAEGFAVEADLADPSQAERAVDRVLDRFGRLDALVNMASVYERTPFASLTPAHYERMIAANLTAPYYAAISAGRAMLAQSPVAGGSGLRGKIVNVGDWASERPRGGDLPYIIAKGALATMTLAMAKELAPHVSVNIVQPGTIAPPAEMPAEDQAAIARATPLGRIGAASDANAAILFLLEGTGFATGTCIRVDGGRFVGIDDTPS